MNDTRRARLRSDYRELMSMVGPVIRMKPISGEAPYVDEYELTVHLRSIVGPEPTYRDSHVIRITLPAGYPNEAYPQAIMVTKPYPFHTNWFPSGRWCYGANSLCTEGLGNFVVRMLQTLVFEPGIINTNSPANDAARTWYMERKKSSLFPCDKTKIPQPAVGGMVVWKAAGN